MTSTTPDIGSLQDEVRQLKRTLEIRKSEILLTSKRVKDLTELSNAMRENSTSCNEKVRELNLLEQSLQREVEKGAALQRELAVVQNAIAKEDAERTVTRSRQLAFFSQIMKILDDMLKLTHAAVGNEPLPPRKEMASLSHIAEEIVTMFDRSAEALSNASMLYASECEKLQNVHAQCVDEIQLAAEENAQRRQDLEESWKAEEAALAKQLAAVKQRAKEAAFHHHRGSGVKFDQTLEERRSITERREVHQECVELEAAIRRAEAEREREKVASSRARYAAKNTQL